VKSLREENAMLAPQELVLVALVAALLFGSKKLPELGKSVGEGLREFKKSLTSVTVEDPASDASDERPVSGSK
jgi:sec-independent protein translocase protein TatA